MAYEDSIRRDPSLIFLAGPIKHWWTCWESPLRHEYFKHREGVRESLVHEGYLTYAPWDAFKGAWTERAQAINDAAIAAADLVLVLTPNHIPADGTADEIAYARRVHTRVLRWPPAADIELLLNACRHLGLTATPY